MLRWVRLLGGGRKDWSNPVDGQCISPSSDNTDEEQDLLRSESRIQIGTFFLSRIQVGGALTSSLLDHIVRQPRGCELDLSLINE